MSAYACTIGFTASGFGIAPNNGSKSCYEPGSFGSLVTKGLGVLSKHGYAGILGLGGEGAGGGFTGGFSRAFVSTTNGQVGMMTTYAGGAGSVLGASVSGGLLVGTSNYTSLSGYADWSIFGSVGGGDGFGGALSASTNASGTAYSLTAGGASGGSASGGVSYSTVTPICK
jgi:hypothetical protein